MFIAAVIDHDDATVIQLNVACPTPEACLYAIANVVCDPVEEGAKANNQEHDELRKAYYKKNMVWKPGASCSFEVNSYYIYTVTITSLLDC